MAKTQSDLPSNIFDTKIFKIDQKLIGINELPEKTRKLNTENSTYFRLLNTCIIYNNRDIDYTCIFLMRTAHNLCI